MDSEPDILEPIRFTWNATPNSKVQQARSMIHPAFHYTPLASQNVPKLDYNPLVCSCEAIFNQYCPIDYHMKTITCCFCGVRTSLPPNYAKIISPEKLPYELMPEISTYDYGMQTPIHTHNQTLKVNSQEKKEKNLPVSSSHCFLFVVDLCLL